MKIIKHPLIYLLIIPLLSLIYIVINFETQQINSLYTDLDQVIPFMKVFIIPYAIWMPFLYLTLIYMYHNDSSLYVRTLMTYTISVILCYVVYLIFQTTVPRPLITDTDFLSKLVMFVYNNDAPFNCFPSIHCLSSYLLFRAAQTSPAIGRVPRTIIGVIAWLIIASTVFVKQHVILDVVAAVALAHVIFTLVDRLKSQQVAKNINKGVRMS